MSPTSAAPSPPTPRPDVEDLGGRPTAHLVVLVLLSLAGAAALTLTPSGDGWSWGAPVVELRWYAEGLGTPSTLVQLVGNVVLLTPAAAAAVLLRPRLARPAVLVPLALVAGTAIEVLQWWLPLGRVVSPTDAVLNASGVVVAGLLARRAVVARATSGARS